MVWLLLGVPLVLLLTASARRHHRRDEREPWLPPHERRRAAGVGHLGQAPAFPHHRMGRL